MTRIRFYRVNGRTTAFESEGHAGYAEEGSDIVCAAVSSALRLTHCFLEDVLGLALQTTVEEDRALIRVALPAQGPLDETAQDAVTALMLHMTTLKDEYPDCIEVTEV